MNVEKEAAGSALEEATGSALEETTGSAFKETTDSTLKEATGYALVELCGKQYQAVMGKTLAIDKIEKEAGENFQIEKVLLVKAEDGSCKIGQPYVKGAVVNASVIKQTRGKKLIVFKFKRRKRVRVKQGHRQELTVIRFESLSE